MDLREYSDSELSMIVYNDEYLYNRRFRLNKTSLRDLGYKFTNDQWNDFKNDREEEKN